MNVQQHDEAYTVHGTDRLLTITGKTPRALLNGVYGWLEEMGAGFYLSFESLPDHYTRIDLSRYHFADSPEVKERIIFNWHNFLSGCSSWDFSEWREWIDQSSKMRFNTIMVHAYGNNPMFTYTFNGREKRISPLPSTHGGRDYGTHDLNDVRRLHGGDLFDHPVFGATMAREVSETHTKEVQQMMFDVFEHAKRQGMNICFALDFDTNPANPQALITQLPVSARFSLPVERNDYSGRFYDSIFWLANPDTPEGYAFYRSQVQTLLDTYPQINQIALWMRHKGSFEWLF